MTPRDAAPDTPSDEGGGAEPTYEEAMAEVERIIERIESGDVGLEEAIASYERGVGLLRQCRDALERAEQRVRDLTERMHRETEGGNDGSAGEAPPDEAPGGDGADDEDVPF